MNIYEGPMDMDNSERTAYGNRGWAGWRREKGEKVDNCHGINNKIKNIKKEQQIRYS